MKVSELFDEWRNYKPLDISLLTIATNGLKAEEDKIIAFSEFEVAKKNEVTYFNFTEGEELEKSQQFHMIKPEVMRGFGFPEEAFKEHLMNVLKKDVIFVYNVPFFSRFIKALFKDDDLHVPLYDISVVYKTVKSKYAFDDEQLNSFEDFYTACMAEVSPMPVGALCTQFKMSKDSSPGQYPFERMMQLLRKVFSEVSSLELQRYQS